jgi:hypothetical protein
MKTLKPFVLGLVLVLLLSSLVAASPFLVSDPIPSAVGASFEIQEKSGAVLATKPNQADGSIRYDLKDVAVGSYTWQIRYVVGSITGCGVRRIPLSSLSNSRDQEVQQTL